VVPQIDGHEKQVFFKLIWWLVHLHSLLGYANRFC
jgi:hypothetical protein